MLRTTSSSLAAHWRRSLLSSSSSLSLSSSGTRAKTRLRIIIRRERAESGNPLSLCCSEGAPFQRGSAASWMSTSSSVNKRGSVGDGKEEVNPIFKTKNNKKMIQHEKLRGEIEKRFGSKGTMRHVARAIIDRVPVGSLFNSTITLDRYGPVLVNNNTPPQAQQRQLRGAETKTGLSAASSACKFLSRTGRDAHLVDQLLRRLLQEEDAKPHVTLHGQDGYINVDKNFVVKPWWYTVAIHAWSNRALDISKQRLALKSFDERNDRIEFGNEHSSRLFEAPERAEQLLRIMDERYRKSVQNNSTRAKPNVIVFNALLDTWARSMHPTAPRRAEQILGWMFTLQQNEFKIYDDLVPDHRTFSSVINAYSQQGMARDAERLLSIMLSSHPTLTDQNDDLSDGTIAEGRDSSIPDYLGSLTKANVPSPNHFVFTMAISAWARSGEGVEAALRAEAIFQKWEQFYERSGRTDHSLQPISSPFNSLLMAWIHSGPSGIDRAEEKFNEMLHRALEERQKHKNNSVGGDFPSSGGMAVMPDVSTFHTLMWAMIEAGQVERADRLLRQFRHLHSSKRISEWNESLGLYTAILMGWVRSSQPDAGERAESVLQLMEESRQVLPTVHPYALAISAWKGKGNIDAPRRAMDLLRRAELVYNGEKENSSKRRSSEQIEKIRSAHIAALQVVTECGDHVLANELFKRLKQYPVCAGNNTVLKSNNLSVFWACTESLSRGKDKKPAVSLAMDMIDRIDKYQNDFGLKCSIAFKCQGALWFLHNSRPFENASSVALALIRCMARQDGQNEKKGLYVAEKALRFAFAVCCSNSSSNDQKEVELREIVSYIQKQYDNNTLDSASSFAVSPFSSSFFRKVLAIASQHPTGTSPKIVEDLLVMAESHLRFSPYTLQECYSSALAACSRMNLDRGNAESLVKRISEKADYSARKG